MANWKAGTSSDAAGTLGYEYGVFLNFRGEDTRYNFTDILYDRLVDVGVHTFRDEEKLPMGDVISDRLEGAINNSKLYIPIFSRNYAFSKWCLRELKLIIDNVSNSGGQKSIFPIFFLVKPDDLKLKTRPDTDAPYKAAFEEHEKNFPGEVEAWKTALGKVDERKGWVVEENTSQAEIIKSVVEKVLKKLETKHKLMNEKIIGLDYQVEYLKKLLDVNHSDVRLIGIYGMGGIGKTTIAKALFNQLSSDFGKRCSFLEDVRENSLTKEGVVELQKKLLSEIVDSESIGQFKDSERGIQRIGTTLSTKEVLVVLDDVDSEEHIKKLIGNSSLHLGSRIIITTRKIDVLQVKGFKGKILRYEMPKMDDGPALKLFCQHAFSEDFPLDDYRGLSSEIMSHMGGLPLAIKVVGSLLNGKGKAFWKEMLAKLKKEPEEEIQKKLRISYDDLDKHQKQIFLDIACFFFNEKKTDAIYMWESCSFYPVGGIDALISRCLIKILDNDKFWMHDQLIDLGRQIVHEESSYDLEEQSRLWVAKEALQIIKTEKIKNKVQALMISTYSSHIEIRNEDFERLPNLRFLILERGTYVGDFKMCRSNLRWFSWSAPHPWKGYGMNGMDLEFRADGLCMDKLVVCKFNRIYFKDDSKAWDLIKGAKDLKVLSITSCGGITTIPNISRCLALERLSLDNCSSLERIESFIGDLQSLIEFNITRCKRLQRLSIFSGLGKLQEVDVSFCPNLIEILVLGVSKSLDKLAVYDCKSLTRISGLSYLKNLGSLDIRNCNALINVEGLNELESLKILSLYRCLSLRWSIDASCKIPDDCCVKLQECGFFVKEGYNISLRRYREEILMNTSNKISFIIQLHPGVTMPSEVWKHHRERMLGNVWIKPSEVWVELKIESRKNFMDLPKEVGQLEKLQCFSSLCFKKLKELPDSFGNLTSLMELDSSGPIPKSIGGLKSLRILRFRIDSFSIEEKYDWLLRCGLNTLVNLEELILSQHNRVEGEIPVGIGEWSSLRILNLGCTHIRRIPTTINKLHQLQILNLTNCHEIQELPELPTSLTCLLLRSKSLLSVPNLSKLTNLVNLLLSDGSDCEYRSNLIPGCDLSWIGNLSKLEWLELRLLNVPIPPELTYLSHLEEIFLGHLDLKPLGQLPSFNWSWGNLSTLEIDCCEMEDISLDGLSRLESLRVFEWKRLKRLSIPSGLSKLRQVNVQSCGKLVEIQVVGIWKSLEYLTVNDCESLTRINGLSYLKNLTRLEIKRLKVLTDVEGLNELDSLKILLVLWCPSPRRLIDASCTKIPDDCIIHIKRCGYFIKEGHGISLKRYREEILLNTSDKISFTIRFHLGGECGWIEREKEGVDPNSVTYEGLIADVKSFGFRFKSMWYVGEEIWYETKKTWRTQVGMTIGSDKHVNEMLYSASRGGFFIHLYVKGGVDSEWEGERDEEMEEMLREERRMKTDAHSDEDGAKGDVSCPNEGSTSAPVGSESETHGTSSVEEIFLDTLNKGKRQRDDDHASHTNTATKSSTCGQQSGIPQHVTRRITRQAAKIQPPVEVAALPVEAQGPSRKRKKNDRKQVNPIRRSARHMKGPTWGKSDIVHLD